MSLESQKSEWMEQRKAFIKRSRIVSLKVMRLSLLCELISTISKEPLMKKSKPVLTEKKTSFKNLMMRSISFIKRSTMKGLIKASNLVPSEMILRISSKDNTSMWKNSRGRQWMNSADFVSNQSLKWMSASIIRTRFSITCLTQ